MVEPRGWRGNDGEALYDAYETGETKSRCENHGGLIEIRA